MCYLRILIDIFCVGVIGPELVGLFVEDCVDSEESSDEQSSQKPKASSSSHRKSHIKESKYDCKK